MLFPALHPQILLVVGEEMEQRQFDCLDLQEVLLQQVQMQYHGRGIASAIYTLLEFI